MLGGADALAPVDGVYDIRLGEPMEEACYLDAARLVAYDLPAGWSMTLDERMGIGGPAPTGEARFYRHAMVASRATMESGLPAPGSIAGSIARSIAGMSSGTIEGSARGAPTDQTAALQSRDNVAADPGTIDHRFIGRIAAERTLTLSFPEALDAHAGEPVLLLDGWVEYPYSSTTFAMWQARAPYQAPTLEALDPANGQWATLVAEYGYPAGMPRQAAFPIDRAALPAGCTTVRMRTTMELYLDRAQLAWLEPCPEARRVQVPLLGASVVDAGFARRIPHAQRRPDYQYSQRAPLWDCRKQPGFYTALGQCTPLLADTDDAVAIFGAGEEVRMQFDALHTPAPAPGAQRTWVLEVDGWCKDMDLYTGDGATLDPLPLRDGHATTPERDALHARFNTRYQGGR